MGELDGKAAVVVGGGRGLGRGIAQSLSAAGASVLAIARHPTGLDELQAANPSIETAIGDATDPDLAAEAVASRDPDILAVVAGAGPSYRPLQDHSWETFSLNWDVDVRLTFNWLREALRKPLRAGEPRAAHEQRRRPPGLSAQRRLRRGEGDDPLHGRLRRRGVHALTASSYRARWTRSSRG